MKLEDSPSLEQYSVFTQHPAPDPKAQKRRLRRWIGVFLAISFLLSSASLLQSRKVSVVFGTGSVQGRVITSDGLPFQGEIYVLGTTLETKTDSNGSFLLQGIPSGERVLIVADEQIGHEFPIRVIAGKQINLGEMRFVATAVPLP